MPSVQRIKKKLFWYCRYVVVPFLVLVLVVLGLALVPVHVCLHDKDV